MKNKKPLFAYKEEDPLKLELSLKLTAINNGSGSKGPSDPQSPKLPTGPKVPKITDYMVAYIMMTGVVLASMFMPIASAEKIPTYKQHRSFETMLKKEFSILKELLKKNQDCFDAYFKIRLNLSKNRYKNMRLRCEEHKLRLQKKSQYFANEYGKEKLKELIDNYNDTVKGELKIQIKIL